MIIITNSITHSSCDSDTIELFIYNRFWLMPAFMLKRQILINLPSDKLEMDVANSIDFMVERVSYSIK